MNRTKGFALATCLVTALSVIAASSASAETTATTKAPTKAQIGAYQTKCSKDADSKGLVGKKKSEERKSFRADCIKKLVDGT